MIRPVHAFLALSALASPLLAQQHVEKPVAPAPQPAAPAKPVEPSPSQPAAAAAYPATPLKNLYANNDVRNKPAPKLEIEEWISARPDLANKTILVDFWATWCAPCRKIIPEMEEWQEKYKSDLVIIGMTAESKKTVENFYDLRGDAIKYSVARDGHNRNYNELGITGIPHVLVISSDGIVRYQGFPTAEQDPLTEAKLKQIIDADKAARAKNPAKPEANAPVDSKPAEPKPVDGKSVAPKPADATAPTPKK